MRERAVTGTAPHDSPGQHLLRMVMDTRILVITLFLMAIGVSLVLSSSSFFAGGKLGDEFALMRNHACRCFVAIVVLFLAARVDYRVYRKAAPMLFLGGLLLMAAVFVCGATIRDTQRWIIIPFIKATLQPSEVAFVYQPQSLPFPPQQLDDAGPAFAQMLQQEGSASSYRVLSLFKKMYQAVRGRPLPDAPPAGGAAPAGGQAPAGAKTLGADG